jgi:hypothetical protein
MRRNLIRATAAPIADPACEARECPFNPSHDAKPVSTGGKIEYRVSTSWLPKGGECEWIASQGKRASFINKNNQEHDP